MKIGSFFSIQRYVTFFFFLFLKSTAFLKVCVSKKLGLAPKEKRKMRLGGTHVRGLVGPLEGPGVGHRRILGHDVRVGLPWFGSLPRLHHGGALPVNVLQTAQTFFSCIYSTNKDGRKNKTFLSPSWSRARSRRRTRFQIQTWCDQTLPPPGRTWRWGVWWQDKERRNRFWGETHRNVTWSRINSLETGDVDVEDEVVVVGASCSALDVITCHLPACRKKATLWL